MPSKEEGYWSEDGIFYADGEGYGRTTMFGYIYLGKEEDIKKFLEGGELNDDLNSRQKFALREIRHFKEQFGIGILRAS